MSTARQEASVLGLDAQRQAVRAFGNDAVVVAEFTEAESGMPVETKTYDLSEEAAAWAFLAEAGLT